MRVIDSVSPSKTPARLSHAALLLNVWIDVCQVICGSDNVDGLIPKSLRELARVVMQVQVAVVLHQSARSSGRPCGDRAHSRGPWRGRCCTVARGPAAQSSAECADIDASPADSAHSPRRAVVAPPRSKEPFFQPSSRSSHKYTNGIAAYVFSIPETRGTHNRAAARHVEPALKPPNASEISRLVIAVNKETGPERPRLKNQRESDVLLLRAQHRGAKPLLDFLRNDSATNQIVVDRFVSG